MGLKESNYKTHDINILLKTIDNFDDNFKITNNDLFDLSTEINGWAIHSRYGKSYLGSVKSAKKCIDIAERLFDNILLNIYNYKKIFSLGCSGYIQYKTKQIEKLIKKIGAVKDNPALIISKERIEIIDKRINVLEKIKLDKQKLASYAERKFRFMNNKVSDKYNKLLKEEVSNYTGYCTLTCMIFRNQANIVVFDSWISRCKNLLNIDYDESKYALSIDLEDFRLSEEISYSGNFNDINKPKIVISTIDDFKYYNPNESIDDSIFLKRILRNIKNNLPCNSYQIEQEKLARKNVHHHVR